jgi:hypothetical protein
VHSEKDIVFVVEARGHHWVREPHNRLRLGVDSANIVQVQSLCQFSPSVVEYDRSQLTIVRVWDADDVSFEVLFHFIHHHIVSSDF